MQINNETYENLIIDLLEKELSQEEEIKLMEFLKADPKRLEILEEYRKVYFQPDEQIKCPDKEALKKNSKNIIQLYQVISAAAILIIAILFFKSTLQNENLAEDSVTVDNSQSFNVPSETFSSKINENQILKEDQIKKSKKEENINSDPSVEQISDVSNAEEIRMKKEKIEINKVTHLKLKLIKIKHPEKETPQLITDIQPFSSETEKTDNEKSWLATTVAKIFDIHISYDKEKGQETIMSALTIKGEKFKFVNKSIKEL